MFFTNKDNSNKLSNEEIIEQKNNSNDKEEDNKEKVVDLSLDSTVVRSLSDRVIGIYTNNQISNYIDYFYKRDKIILANEPLNMRLAISSHHLATNYCKYAPNLENTYLDESLVKDAYESLFGKNGKYQPTSFNGDCGIEYHYDKKDLKYKSKVPAGCGGTSCGGSFSKLGYAKQIITDKTDTIELYEYYYRLNGDDVCIKGEGKGVAKIYSDYNSKNLILLTKDIIKEEQIFANYRDKLGLYKYTFVKDNSGTYVFTSVEKIK